jgi:hypothetical protein
LDKPPPIWNDLLSFNHFNNDFDDPYFYPQLHDECLTPQEQEDRNNSVLGHDDQREVVVPGHNEKREEMMFDQDIQRNFDPVPSRPGPIEPEPNFRPPPEPEPQPDPYPNLRRSTRTRKAPGRYTFDKAHGYWNAKTIAKSIFKALIFAPASQYDFRFIHALLLDSSTGTLSNVVSNCSDTFRPLFGLKSKIHDPDTPNMGEAMTGPYREEFLAAMRQEIEELEGHKTWKVLKRSSLPEGANILPSTWAFKIKRYPDGRLRKFKAQFCVRGDMQIEGVDY